VEGEPFLDRDWELGWLQGAWESGTAEFRILYGRRRVGKSALLDEFARGKRCIVYQAVEGTTADQLRDLTSAILACEPDPVLREAPLPNWEAALQQFNRMASNGRLLVILDEYQYAAMADRTLASRIQRWWSREAAKLPICLVLCGSYIRFFEENVLNGPAYGRHTGFIQLHPLSYREAGLFLPGWSAEDRIRAFAVTGGMPHYLRQLDPHGSLAWNIAHNVLERGAVLYQEAELVVREELREPRVYYSILRAISDGCTEASKISDRVQLAPRTNIAPYLQTLRDLGFVDNREAVVGRTMRRGIWILADPYLRFWFRFVLPNKQQLDTGHDVERFYRTAVAPRLDDFVSKPIFEDICRAWVGQQIALGAWPGVTKVGSWWGPMPKPLPDNRRNQVEAEIAVVAAAGDQVVLAGEAKWTNKPVGFDVLNHLRSVVDNLPGADASTQLMLFGRRFEPRLGAAAEAEGIRLITPAQLYA